VCGVGGDIYTVNQDALSRYSAAKNWMAPPPPSRRIGHPLLREELDGATPSFCRKLVSAGDARRVQRDGPCGPALQEPGHGARGAGALAARHGEGTRGHAGAREARMHGEGGAGAARGSDGQRCL
jgi:hypothetical protein